MQQQLTYLFDPLCGWCYGASPAVEELSAQEDLSVEIVPTGLFAGAGAFAMSAGFAAHAWAADQRIAQLTGQRFSAAYRRNVLENPAARVDSRPATLALTAVRLTAPQRELEALKAIQLARYVDGRDNGDAAVVVDVLAGLGLTAAAARFDAADEELLSATRARSAQGQAELRRFGARGVPALIAGSGDTRGVVGSSALYGDPAALLAALRAA